MQMLQSDWLIDLTLSAISVQWLGVVDRDLFWFFQSFDGRF